MGVFPEPGGLLARYGRRETLPPSRTTSSKDLLAARGLHARAKPMATPSLGTARLIGALHNFVGYPRPNYRRPDPLSRLGVHANRRILHSMRTTLSPDSSQWPEVWQSAYRILGHSIVENQLRAWIQPLNFVGTEAAEGGWVRVRFCAPNDFSARWVRDRYLRAMEEAFSTVTGSRCEIVLEARDPSPQPPERLGSDSADRAESPLGRGVPSSDRGAAESVPGAGLVIQTGFRLPKATDCPLDVRYNFENFVVGASNQFAHASAVAVAEQPARQYNPLFLYSPPGLGKTHLLHAIGNHVLTKNPKSRVAYLSAERFVNELIESIQHNRMPQFRTKYRDSFDLILIDDIQFIAGKPRTEEEFFHTFNALHSSKRQIVVTSDRPPKEIEGLEERVRTRFEWGLVADIHPPEIETRIAILKAKAEREDIYLPDDIATFLATHVKSNVRELEGVLIRLQAQASLTGAEISLEMAKQELKMAVPEEGSHLTVESVLAAVAKHFRLKLQDLRSSSRARAVALPRQIAMFLIRKYTDLGFADIGPYFGGKDHSTVLYACQKIEKALETDHQIRDQVESIQNLL